MQIDKSEYTYALGAIDGTVASLAFHSGADKSEYSEPTDKANEPYRQGFWDAWGDIAHTIATMV